MDGLEHIPIATLAPDLFVVTLNGLSKSHRVAGFRVGWMVLSGDKSHVKGYRRAEYVVLHAFVFQCIVSANYPNRARRLSNVDELLLPGGRIYEQREYIYNAINDIPGLSAVKPKAAFIFPKLIQSDSIFWMMKIRLDFYMNIIFYLYMVVDLIGTSQIIFESFIFLKWMI